MNQEADEFIPTRKSLLSRLKNWEDSRKKFKEDLASELSNGKYSVEEIEEFGLSTESSYWYDSVEVD